LPSEPTSVWLVVGPALVAGGIGLVSAALSFISSQRSLAHGSEVEEAAHRHQLDLLVLNRRLSAIESIWQCLFEIERTKQLSDALRGEVIRAVVWLPDTAGETVLKAVLSIEEGSKKVAIQEVRELLLALTKTTEERSTNGDA
jgi:hypothetical protein